MDGTPPIATTTRRDLVRFRFRRHDLHRPPGDGSSELPDIVDYGVQDTGTDGAEWALANRGAPPGHEGMVLAWTLRGAPHAYRRADVGAVAVATAPYSEADAAKRIFDAAAPLRAARIPVLEALRNVATLMRDVVDTPRPKGEVSALLTDRLDAPYLRQCRPCDATHTYEQPFRLSALQAGLELEWGTSPPVLRRLPRRRPLLFGTLAGEAERRFDPIRNHLRFYPGARVRDVAAFVDMPVKEVRANWPDDAVEIALEDDPTPGKVEPRFVLREDVVALSEVDDEDAPRAVRLLGPHDPYLQLRDRELLVDDEVRRKDLWRVLGRPGAIVADGEVVGTWRPSTEGRRFRVRATPWGRTSVRDREEVAEQAERLAAHRGLDLAEVTDED